MTECWRGAVVAVMSGSEDTDSQTEPVTLAGVWRDDRGLPGSSPSQPLQAPHFTGDLQKTSQTCSAGLQNFHWETQNSDRQTDLDLFFCESREQRTWLDLLYDGRQKFHVERWECWRSLWTTVQNVLYSVMFEVLIRLVQTWQSSVSHLALHYYDFKFPSQNCLYQIPLLFRESQWNVEFECKVYSESPLITKILDPQKTFLLLELSRVDLNWTSGLIIPSQAAVDNFPALGNVGSKNSRNRQIRPHVKREGKGWTQG